MKTSAPNYSALFVADLRSVPSLLAAYRLPENRQMIYGTGLVFAMMLIAIFGGGFWEMLAKVVLYGLALATLFRVADDDYNNSPFAKGINNGLMVAIFVQMLLAGLDWVALDGSF